jgi:hypothetical protein
VNTAKEALMRAVYLCVVPVLAAGALSAQAPESRPPSPPPGRPAASVWFDAGALLEHQIRAGFEAVTLGRATIGVSITYDDRAHARDDYSYPLPYAVPETYLGVRDPIPCDVRSLALCAYPSYYPYGGESPRYRAWSFNVAARFYPRFLSFRNGPRQMMVYAGGFLGFHWRVADEVQPIYYNNPLVDTVPRPLAPRDSVVVIRPDSASIWPPYPIPCCSNPVRRTISGLQPGIEIGVRLMPLRRVFVEAGGRFSLVTIDDPWRRARLGDVESRLVIAGGIVW